MWTQQDAHEPVYANLLLLGIPREDEAFRLHVEARFRELAQPPRSGDVEKRVVGERN